MLKEKKTIVYILDLGKVNLQKIKLFYILIIILDNSMDNLLKH
jgi:hypothetical protein